MKAFRAYLCHIKAVPNPANMSHVKVTQNMCSFFTIMKGLTSINGSDKGVWRLDLNDI